MLKVAEVLTVCTGWEELCSSGFTRFEMILRQQVLLDRRNLSEPSLNGS